MRCVSDERINAMRAPQRVTGRTQNGRPLMTCLVVVLLAMLLLAPGFLGDKVGHAASVYQSGGIIADDKPAKPAKPTKPVEPAKSVTPAKSVKPAPKKAPQTPSEVAPDDDEPPPSSKQNKDGPLQAAPDISPDISERTPPPEPENTRQAPSEEQAGKDPARKEQRPAPRTTKATPTQPTGFRLFGTVEFKGPIKNLTSWISVLDRQGKNSVFQPEKKLGSTAWKDLKGKLEKMQPAEQLQTVNRFWNQWPYRQDSEVYKKADYWAIPAEFVKNSGDCEDYAIAKYFTLKEIGYDTSQMRIVVLMETVRNIAHAVLVVYRDGDAFVLDNLSTNVLSHSRYRNYLPQYSVNEEFRWAHVRPK